VGVLNTCVDEDYELALACDTFIKVGFFLDLHSSGVVFVFG
jgi:hypothetical protein